MELLSLTQKPLSSPVSWNGEHISWPTLWLRLRSGQNSLSGQVKVHSRSGQN